MLTSTASMSWTSRRLPTSAPLDAGALANSSATASLITIGVFAPAGCLNLRYGPGEVCRRRQRVGDRVDLTADIHRDHVGAVLGQAHRVATALSPGRAGDQRDLAVEPSRHRDPCLPRVRVCCPRRCPIGCCGAGDGPTDTATATTCNCMTAARSGTHRYGGRWAHRRVPKQRQEPSLGREEWNWPTSGSAAYGTRQVARDLASAGPRLGRWICGVTQARRATRLTTTSRPAMPHRVDGCPRATSCAGRRTTWCVGAGGPGGLIMARFPLREHPCQCRFSGSSSSSSGR